jgi:uncharacterized membrane protein YbaN (DUF454 family)
MRLAWIAIGLSLTGVGFAGVVLPLVPATPFFLLAAFAFARGSPRWHAWLLSLPRIGPAIDAYQCGLGVPRRIKLLAVVMAGTAVSLATLALDHRGLQAATLVLGAVGIGYVLLCVPTRRESLRSVKLVARR